MTLVFARAPLRLGFAGGGTDLPVFYKKYGGSVLNATISLYAHTEIYTQSEPKICFKAIDLNIEQTILLDDLHNELFEPTLLLHLEAYRFAMKKFNNGVYIPLTCQTYCEAPIGSGLGSSSTIVVSMLKGYAELLGIALSKRELAEHAFYVERKLCGFAGGYQDQISAAYGGMNFISFDPQAGFSVSPLELSENLTTSLETQLVLFFSATSRHSSTVISHQSSGIVENKDSVIASMLSMKQEAEFLYRKVKNNDISYISDIIESGWLHKKSSSSRVSNNELEAIRNSAISAGAITGKISGAGGGGVFWFLVPLGRRFSVLRSLEEYNGYVSFCKLEREGAISWSEK